MKPESKFLFKSSDFFHFFMLFMMLVSFVSPIFNNINIRHAIVFLGGSCFYFLALKQIFSTRFEIGLFVRLVLMLLIIFFGILATAEEIRWELIYASLNFYCLFVFVSTNNIFAISYRFYKWNGWIFVIIALILIALSQSSVAYIFEDGRETGALALGMTNPNLTGLLISGVFSMLLINFNSMKYKPIIVLVMGYLIYLILLTGARNAFISTMFLLIYALFYKDKKIPSYILIIMMLIPVLFILVYLQLYWAGFEDFVFLGKDFFSGRQNTFIYYWESLKTPLHYLFGNIGFLSFANALNGPLAVFCNVGFVGFLLFYWNLGDKLLFLNKMAYSQKSRLAMVCILGVCLQASAESLMFLGVFPSSAFVYFYFLIASSNEQHSMDLIKNNCEEI